MPKNRILLVVFAFVLAGVLVACGEQNDTASRETLTPTTQTEQAATTVEQAVDTDSSADPDLIFIDGMIVHHQSAIEMAQAVSASAERQETLDLVEDIIREQQREIDQMMTWRDEWFPGSPESDLSHMMDMSGMDMSEHDMDALHGAHDADATFMEMMIPHHESAIDMAHDILKTTDRQELRDLAETIISTQQTEIEHMHEWLSEWSHD